MLELDHVMYVVRDLESAARRIREELGLDSYAGGEHAGRGTANRIVPLGGGQYVELMAVIDDAIVARSDVGRRILEWASAGDAFHAWCVATDEIDAVAHRLRLNAEPWTRVLPDGSALAWRLVGVEQAIEDPSLPFFIQWDVPAARHPSRVDVRHHIEPRGIAWIEVGGDAERIRSWTRGAELPVRVVAGAPGPRALAIATARGEVVWR